MINKKGMTMQVFTFIFALIFIAITLGYGVKTLVTIKDTGDDVELANFVLKLRDDVKTMYAFDVGSKKNAEYFLPVAVERVCFYSSDEETTVFNVDQELKNYIDTNPKRNLVVEPFSFSQNVYFVEHLIVMEENPLCFLRSGKLKVELETVLSDEGKVYVGVHRLV